MECCSPDVGDCQKCHPELWIVTRDNWTLWKPKKSKNRKTRRRTDLHRKKTK
uniref:Uncharacterized protein n=1 Tax=viral metagenome TaxID=1070528 RepID=A0A6C0EP89_9ZZZZ